MEGQNDRQKEGETLFYRILLTATKDPIIAKKNGDNKQSIAILYRLNFYFGDIIRINITLIQVYTNNIAFTLQALYSVANKSWSQSITTNLQTLTTHQKSDIRTNSSCRSVLLWISVVFVFCRLINKNVLEWFLLIYNML